MSMPKTFTSHDFSKMEFEKLKKLLLKKWSIDVVQISSTIFGGIGDGILLGVIARSNAWICAICRQVPFIDSLNNPQDLEIHFNSCEYREDPDPDVFEFCECNTNSFPFTIFNTTHIEGMDTEAHAQVDLCHSCMEKYKIVGGVS